MQIVLLQEDGIGRYAIALCEHHEIAAHHFAPGDAPALAVANDQRPRTGEVAERFQDAFGAGLLDHRDQDGQGCEGQQDDGFFQIAQNEIDRTAAEEQRQHRLPKHLEDDAKCRPLVRARQFVVPVRLESRLRLGLCETVQRGGSDVGSHHHRTLYVTVWSSNAP